ncbi:MAG: DUF4032 domain-containing protein [Puniceicoccales bacterium]|jgi:hypothetical protein|nr:DUF4032 domain-containing protein [Puniceicoccales bacterium]
MPNSPSAAQSGDFTPMFSRSFVVQMFRDELDEINRHKWYLSEEHRGDVGFDFALMNWVKNHRDAWRSAYVRARYGALMGC